MKRIALSVLAVALAAGVPAAPTPESLLAAGRQAMIRGEGEKAAELFEQAIKLRPNDSNYHLWLANAYGSMALQTKNPFKMASLGKKSKAALERAVQLDPNNLDARMGLLDFYDIAPGLMGGDDEKARQQAEEIRKRDGLAGHRAFARIYARDKKLDAAHKEYEDAIREDPTSAKPHMYYAIQLGGEKNYKGASEQLEAAARVESTFMPTYFQIGRLAVLSMSNYGRGEESLKKYLAYTPAENEPSHIRAWFFLGQLYEKLGKKAEAKQSYQAALKLAPGAKDVMAALKRVS